MSPMKESEQLELVSVESELVFREVPIAWSFLLATNLLALA